jgi:transitional endoplasmic reticulum ATPase
MKEKNKEASNTFKVKEALPKDVGRAIVRIDPDDMKTLDLDVGDIVEIEGKRKTPVKLMPCYVEERGKRFVQMDGITRENAKVGIDEKVSIRKANHKLATRITLSPMTLYSLSQKDRD